VRTFFASLLVGLVRSAGVTRDFSLVSLRAEIPGLLAHLVFQHFFIQLGDISLRVVGPAIPPSLLHMQLAVAAAQ